MQRQFQGAALRVLLNKALQVLKETPENCDIFNATNFHRSHGQLFNFFSTQLKDQKDSDTCIQTLQLYLINQNFFTAFNIQKDTDAEIMKEGQWLMFSTRQKLILFQTSMLVIYYIADLPVTHRRLLTNKSENISVPYASLRSLILPLSSTELRLFLTRFYVARGMLDSASHNK